LKKNIGEEMKMFRKYQLVVWDMPLDAFYQASIHLAKRVQRRRFLKIDQSKSRIDFGGNVY
jgi:hypothetical protein